MRKDNFVAILIFCVLMTMISTLRYSKRWPAFYRKNNNITRPLSEQCSSSSRAVIHPSFENLNNIVVSEYGLNGTRYRHKKSGAEVISISTQDDNKVFGITFRTPPKDSTGVPHVLEHSVLCGSRKFPVKEPFVDMLRGSLQNFLNAFTYPDRTCYPVASTNTKDFYNLVNVYLDAVLHPRAVSDPQVLQQEGWHYELEGDEVAGALSIKGVVYNEMKGVYSSPDALMARATQQALFPHNAYGVDSGGDPQKIPDLSFEQFRAFHSQYYHPSNSRVFFYGDDDPLKRLELLDSYLRDFDAISADKSSAVVFQPLLAQPQRLQVPFPISTGTEPKHMLTVNWVLNHDTLSPVKAMALSVLDYLLLGTSSAPLKKALIESNLGESVTGGGLSDELLQSTYSVGLKGILPADTGKVENVVQQTLRRLAQEGFDAADVQAAMNTFEFKLREFNSGGYPRGLLVMLGMMQHWIYDRPAENGVQFEAPLQELKDKIASGVPLFQDLLKDHFVHNMHQVVVEMTADSSLERKRFDEERALLSSIKEGMTPMQLQAIVQDTLSLREAQEAADSSEARATLPRLGLEDIDPIAKELPIEVLDETALRSAGIAGASVLLHHTETSGILYVDVAFDYSGMEQEDLELLPLFTRMLMESGTDKYDLALLTRKIGTNTGGIGVSLHNDYKSAGNRIVEPDQALLYLLIRGKAVREHLPVLFELFSDILLCANLGNQKRALEMLRESKARKEAAILSSGHSYAATRLSSQSTFLGYLNEVTSGLTSVRAAGALLERVASDWPAIEVRLNRMRQSIIRKGSGGVVVNLTGDENITKIALPHVRSFLDALPTGATTSAMDVVSKWKSTRKIPLNPINEGFVLPSQVNYVALGGPVLVPGSVSKGSYSVATRFLSTGYLWDQVRVVGGAYGGFARFSETTGRFVYLSYRDPNCIDTLEAYNNAPGALNEADLSSEELLQAVIGSIGDLDTPMSADQKGFASLVQYLNGETAQDRQRLRSDVLATTQADFKEFALHLSKLRESGTIVVFGSQHAIDAANNKLPEHRRMAVEQALAGNHGNEL